LPGGLVRADCAAALAGAVAPSAAAIATLTKNLLGYMAALFVLPELHLTDGGEDSAIIFCKK